MTASLWATSPARAQFAGFPYVSRFLPSPHRLPSLTIAISTTGDRLRRMVLPRPHPGVGYLILVQSALAHDLSCLPRRADITVCRLASRGLSHSRNAALDRARTSLLLFSDDDVTLDMGGIDRLRQCLRDCADVAMVAGYRSGRRIRRWTRAPMTRFNTGRICAPELMLRPAAFHRAHLRFDPAFGLGARNGMGEEYVFVTDALRAGLRGFHLPVITGAHPGTSTGQNWADHNLLAARAAVITRVFGRAAPLVRPAYALRHAFRFPSARDAVAFALGTSAARQTSLMDATVCR